MAKLIHMISGPRNMSTAIMYAFDSRMDTIGVDEPFYARYLSLTNIDHPGRAEILASQSHDHVVIIEQIEALKSSDHNVLIKNMAHHIINIELREIPADHTILLMRDPAKLIHSYSKVREQITLDDIGIVQTYKLWQSLEASGADYIIVDSDDLLSAPRVMFQKICQAIDIDMDEQMLQWQAGPRAIDGIWAKYWYDNVHRSTGIKARPTTTKLVAEKYRLLYDEAMPYYEQLQSHKL